MDFQCAADHLDPFLHPDQSHARRSSLLGQHCRNVESSTIILYRQSDLFGIFLKLHANLGRVAMPRGVGQRLLQKSIDADRRRPQVRHFSAAVSDLDLRSVGEL